MPRGSALARANAWVAAHAAFDADYVPVGRGCLVLRLARSFGIHTVAVALAASYYQRVHEALADAPADCPLADILLPHGVVRFTWPNFEGRSPMVFQGAFRGEEDRWPLVVLTVCLHVATKVTHAPRNSPRALGGYGFSHLLRELLGMRLRDRDMYTMEMWVLWLLKFRVVPLPPPEPWPAAPTPTPKWLLDPLDMDPLDADALDAGAMDMSGALDATVTSVLDLDCDEVLSDATDDAPS